MWISTRRNELVNTNEVQSFFWQVRNGIQHTLIARTSRSDIEIVSYDSMQLGDVREEVMRQIEDGIVNCIEIIEVRVSNVQSARDASIMSAAYLCAIK